MNHIIQLFKKSLEKDRLSHLYLLVGAQGEHKKKLAYQIAYQIASFYNDNPNLKHQIYNDNYPNVTVISKDGIVIKKEQIAMLQDEFSKTSLVSGPRIYIVEGIETLSPSAANSLLKFMEEPQGVQTIGLLLTDQKDLVLPTIISRSQVIYLNENTEGTLTNLLLENDFSLENALIIPFLTQDLEEARALSEDPNYNTVVSLFEKITNSWLSKDVRLVMLFKSCAPILYSDRKWIYLLLNLLLRYFVDIVELWLKQKPYFTFLEENYKKVKPQLPMVKCEKNIKNIQKTLNKMNYYINLELAVETLLIDLEKSR